LHLFFPLIFAMATAVIRFSNPAASNPDTELIDSGVKVARRD
jgi:hypothetical protein